MCLIPVDTLFKSLQILWLWLFYRHLKYLNTLKLSAGRWVVAGGEDSGWVIGSCHIMTFSSVAESLFQ